MALKKQFNLKVILFLLIVVSNSACKHKQTDSKALKTQWKTQNMQILRDFIQEKCNEIRHDSLNYFYLREHPIKQSIEDGRLKENYMISFKKSLHVRHHFFSEENVNYYLRQLSETETNSYVANVKSDSCIKKELPEDLSFNGTFLNQNVFLNVSKAVFTKNNKYALFKVWYYGGVFLYIYKNENSNFVPYKSNLIGFSIE